TQLEGGAQEPSPYRFLLDIVGSTARVDVISGTSAGGLNGGFLALATAYDSTLQPLGDLWAESGALAELMRGPLDSHPPSLLKGDEYFLPKLRDAFDAIRRAGTYVDPGLAPLDLTITTSLMDGRLQRSVDDFGTPVVEMEHRGRFHYEREESTLPSDDPFSDSDISGRLALAARSTASFPFAFEPSFIPVGEAGPDANHPTMQPNRDFTPGEFPGSRFVLDGGVLLNKPVGPALEAIFRQSADRQVRRVLLYVNPDPGSPKAPAANKHGEPYALARVMTDSLMTLPRAQSITQDLADLRDHNRRARDQQQIGPDLFTRLGTDAGPLAEKLFPSYKRVRLRLIVNSIVDASPPPETPGGPPSWTREELVSAFDPEGAKTALALPFLPTALGLPADDGWDWGVGPVERLGWATLDVLGRGMQAAPVDDQAQRQILRNARRAVHAQLRELRSFHANEERYWQSVAANLPKPPDASDARKETLRNWAGEVARGWPGATVAAAPPVEEERTENRLREVANNLLKALLDAVPSLRAAVTLGAASREPMVRKEAQELHVILTTLLPSGQEALPDAAATQLLAVEVCYVSLTGGFPPPGQDVLFMQVDGNTADGFGGTLDTKLAGVQLGHFGAFYKKSWRVNDWVWGRIDGATKLTEAVLGPKRLRQLGYTLSELTNELRAAVVGPENDPYLGANWDRHQTKIAAELSFLDDKELPIPPALPTTAGLLALRLHVGVLQDELGRLAAAVEFDIDEKAERHGPGPTFAAAYRDAALRYENKIPSEQLVSLFERAGIGRERIAREAGTDLLARTASTAAAVAVATIDMPGVKLGPARAVLRSLRAFTLTLYALVYGSTVGSKFGAAVVNLALCAGGALLAVSLLSGNSPPLITALAAVLVMAGFAAAALRSRLWLLALALGVPLVILAVAVAAGGAATVLRSKAPVIAAVVGLILATALFGSVRIPARPLAEVREKARPIVALVFVVSLMFLAGVFTVVMDRSPGQMFALERAGTVTRSSEVLRSWTGTGVLDRAAETLWLHYLLIAMYWIPVAILVSVVARGCLRRERATSSRPRPTGTSGKVTEPRPRTWARWWTVGAVLSWLAVYAALLDAAEHVLLLMQVAHVRGGANPGSINPILPAVAAALATLKYAFLGAALAYIVVLGPTVLVGGRCPPRTGPATSES
nr:patatin-like protein [Actinomycetota bacterium]